MDKEYKITLQQTDLIPKMLERAAMREALVKQYEALIEENLALGTVFLWQTPVMRQNPLTRHAKGIIERAKAVLGIKG